MDNIKDFRIPIKYLGDDNHEWTGGFVIDSDKLNNKWNSKELKQ